MVQPYFWFDPNCWVWCVLWGYCVKTLELLHKFSNGQQHNASETQLINAAACLIEMVPLTLMATITCYYTGIMCHLCIRWKEGVTFRKSQYRSSWNRNDLHIFWKAKVYLYSKNKTKTKKHCEQTGFNLFAISKQTALGTCLLLKSGWSQGQLPISSGYWGRDIVHSYSINYKNAFWWGLLCQIESNFLK